MPQLNIYNFSTEEPANIVARQVIATLRAVVDSYGLPINQSVERGLDSVLWDVMYGGPLSSDSQFPMIRVFAAPSHRETDDGLTGIAGTVCQLSLYFLYYIGNPATDPVQTSFEEARNNHIRANLDALRADRCVPFSDNVTGEAWRWLTDEEAGSRQQDNETPFKYLDATYTLHPGLGYTCSRVDWPFWVKGVLGSTLTPVY